MTTWRRLSLLVSKSLTVSDLSERLEGLSERVLSDNDPNTWRTLLAAAKSLGFADYSAPSSSPAQPANLSLPVAFESSNGKNHLQATAALLGVSQRTVVSLTLGALQSQITTTRGKSNNQEFQSLLGTQRLLLKVLEYHHQQRIARMSVLAECLRVEQDSESPYREAVEQTLNKLDDGMTATNTSSKRGLFGLLVSATAAPTETAFSREELEPARQVFSHQQRQQQSFKQFCADAWHIRQVLTQHEQQESAAALIALLYNRIDGGVSRSDLALLLLLLQQQQQQPSSRLSQLLSLMCAEATALWRVTATSEKELHPLFFAADAHQQLQTLTRMLQDMPSSPGAPQALVVLSFGLLLRSSDQDLAALGTKLVTLANDELDAFGYLYAVMDDLVETAPSSDNGNLELSAPSLIYASIGREILTAFVHLYKESLLSLRHSGLQENITLLCNLAAKIHCNSPILSEQFWADWDAYAKNAETAPPLCVLMDAAYSLAVTEISRKQQQQQQDGFLLAVTPLVRFVSAFVHSPEMVETAVSSIFPQGLLARALVAAAVPHKTENFLQARKSLLESIRTLAKIASSSTKKSLQQSLATTAVDNTTSAAPQLLLQLAVEDPQITEAALEALSCLLGNNSSWTLAVARCVKWMQVSENLWARLLQEHGRHATQLVQTLTQNVGTLVFSVDDATANELLDIVQTAVLSSAELLTMQPTTSTKQVLSYETARAAMDCMADALQYLGPILELRPSPLATTFCNRLVQVLVVRIGEAVMYYATAPVTLSLAQRMEAYDADLVQAMSNDQSTKYGLFQVIMARRSEGDDKSAVLATAIDELDTVSLDFTNLQRKGWLGENDDSMSPLRAAESALSLLQQWSRVVELSRPETISTSSPYQFLAQVASLPPPAHVSLSSVWNKANMPNVALFSRYMTVTEKEGATVRKLSTRAMEFLSTGLAHSKLDLATAGRCSTGTGGDKVFSAIFDSVEFHSAMRKCITSTLALVGQDTNVLGLEAGLHGLSVLAVCTEVSPAIACRVIGVNTEESILKSFFDSIKSAVRALVRHLSEGGFRLHADKSLLRDLSISRACLDVILHLWNCMQGGIHRQNESSFIREIASALDDEEASLLPHLLDAISTGSEACQPVASGSLEEQYSNSVFVDFTRVALNTVVTMIASIPSDSDEKDKKALAGRALESVFGEELAGLVALSPMFTIIPSFSAPETIYRKFCSRIVVLKNATVSRTVSVFSSSSSVVHKRLSFDPEAVDQNFAARWINAVFPSGSAGELSYENLAISYKLLTSELERMMAWKSFVAHVAMLEAQKWRGAMKSTSLLSLSMAQEAVAALKQNLIALEQLHNPSVLADEAHGMTMALSCFPIHFVSSADLSRGVEQDNWVSFLDAIAVCCKKIVLGVIQPQHLSACVEKLLASAAVLLTAPIPVSSTAEGRRVCLQVAEVTCLVVRSVEQQTPNTASPTDDWNCLSVCVSVLASLVAWEGFASNGTSWEDDSAYSQSVQLHGLLKNFDVVRSLVWQVTNKAAPDKLHKKKKNERKLLVLAFLLKLAMVGEPDTLSLLVDSDVSLILPRSTTFSIYSDETLPMRGYFQAPENVFDGTKKSLQVGKMDAAGADGEENTEHLIWRASMKFIAASLRSINATIRDHVTTRFFEIALDFLSVNKTSILACLEQCAAVSFDSNFPVLTLNVLREASCILSIVNELCSTKAVDLFKRNYHDLFESLLGLARSLLPSLGSFLGASGSSRELFRAIDDLEEADSMALDYVSQLAALGPMYYVLAEGLSNGRHEAIRYSHFVSLCSTAVTPEDRNAQKLFPEKWRPDNRARSGSDPHSLSTLERKCREAVTSRLSFQMEYEAGQVLYFTLYTLWRTHPTASAFVWFSEDEAAHLDAMSLVRPGMSIAFRQESQSRSGLLVRYEGSAAGTPHRTEEEQVYYAKVMNSDTVHRRWEVSLRDGEIPVTALVTAAQLAGIEDTARRRGTLGFGGAPVSSTELEAAVGTPGVGHLILTLRWCSQFIRENRDEPLHAGAPSLAIRLAELATAFLGTEVSIQRESSAANHADAAAMKTLALQILDLFGEESDFEELAPLERRKGRLDSMISKDCWESVRFQLRKEIQMATAQLTVDSHRGRSRLQNGGDILVRKGGTTTQSPFRGLGI